MPFDPIEWVRSRPWLACVLQGSAAISLALWAFHIIAGLQPDVDASFRSFPSHTENPDSMLNHANTYYWWGRYRKNTLPEFDTAAKLAGRAMGLAALRLKSDGDTSAFRERERQANQILSMARIQSDICRYNIASHVPVYMEAMGLDQPYMQEDADAEEVRHVALRGAIGRITELLSPGRTQAIQSLSHFALVAAQTSNPMAEEMIVQELNNSTRLYTVSRHELAKALGRDTIDVAAVCRDTADLARLARHFSTDELALIDFTENDRVDGIYYYGMRLRLWSASKGLNPQNIYTEFMVRDRVFNEMAGFILPLFLAFLLLAAALNLLVNSAAAWPGTFDAIHPLYIPICLTLGVGFQYALTTFGLGNLAKPAPEDFYAADAAEMWTIAFPITFLLPALLSYLVLGKMDNFISRFRSDLENPGALFALAAGTLMVVPFVMTYLYSIRFGTHLNAPSILPSLGAGLLIALLIARHGSSIVNFPERVHPALRILTWLSLLAYLGIAYLLLQEWTTHYDGEHVWGWLTGSLLPTAALLEAARWALTRFLEKKRPVKTFETAAVKPEGLEPYSITGHGVRTLFREAPTGTLAASLYVNAKKGMPATEAVQDHFQLGVRENLVLIDFEKEVPAGREVHYHPFALAFQDRLAFIKFNDAAETARKTSNMLGKLLSSITSLGGLIVDERSAIPRDPAEVAEMLLDAYAGKPCVWLLDNVERIRDEDMDLFKAVVAEIKARVDRQRSHPDGERLLTGLPLLVVCGHGEYGHRERLMATLKSLADKTQSGVLLYEMRYRDLAMRILEGEKMPVQVRLHLEQLLRRENRDHSPVTVKQTLEALWKRRILFTSDGVGTSLARLDELNTLPEVSLGFGLPNELQKPSELRDALTAAAYLADGDGRFHLPAIARVLGMERMALLQQLKEAERLNLVYDLKGHTHFYWYSFTDRSLMAGLKELENPRQKEVSQLANEFYRGFVEHHCSLPDGGFSADRLSSDHASGGIDTETLTMVAERAHAVHPAFPSLAFDVNGTAAEILGGNGIARFEQALACTERALAIADTIPPKEHEAISKKLYDIKKQRFEMLLETGGYRNTDMDSLLDEIQRDLHHPSQREEERLAFELSVAKLRFLRFKRPDDEVLGEITCTMVKEESKTEAERLRAEFYSIKLVPSNLLVFGGHPEWPRKALETAARYRELLAGLELTYRESPKKKELYRQVLNDYGGSFLTDKVMPLSTKGSMGGDGERIRGFLKSLGIQSPDQALAKVEELLYRRIDLETETAGWKKPLSETNIMDRLKELLSNEDPSVDKRGLCFTLNYLSRAYRTVGEPGKSVAMGLMSYRFNALVGDVTGCCIAAGTVAYGYTALGEASEAYRWYERSFGHAWAISHRSGTESAMQMLRTARALMDSEKEVTARFHIRQTGLQSVYPQFPFESIDGDTADLMLTSPEGLRHKDFAAEASRLLGDDPVLFLDGFLDWVNSVTPKPDGRGQGTASWLKGEKPLFEWAASPEYTIADGLTGMDLKINETEGDKGYAIRLIRDETPTWQVSSMTSAKAG